jgi:hypothetical protein
MSSRIIVIIPPGGMDEMLKTLQLHMSEWLDSDIEDSKGVKIYICKDININTYGYVYIYLYVYVCMDEVLKTLQLHMSEWLDSDIEDSKGL